MIPLPVPLLSILTKGNAETLLQFHQPVTPYPTGNSGKPLQCTPKDTKRSPAVLGAFQDGKQTRYIDVMFTRRRGNGKLNRLHMYGCVP